MLYLHVYTCIMCICISNIWIHQLIVDVYVLIYTVLMFHEFVLHVLDSTFITYCRGTWCRTPKGDTLGLLMDGVLSITSFNSTLCHPPIIVVAHSQGITAECTDVHLCFRVNSKIRHLAKSWFWDKVSGKFWTIIPRIVNTIIDLYLQTY